MHFWNYKQVHTYYLHLWTLIPKIIMILPKNQKENPYRGGPGFGHYIRKHTKSSLYSTKQRSMGHHVGNYILIFGENHYDFWNQRPKNIRNRCVPICNSKKAYIGPPPTEVVIDEMKPLQCSIVLLTITCQSNVNQR